MINVKNNSKSKLAGDLTNENFFYCLPGEGGIFPERDFIVTLEAKNKNKEIIKRMIVEISNRNDDRFEIRNKSVEFCVQDDSKNPKKYTNNILNFSSGDDISLYFTAGMYENFLDKNNNLSDLENLENTRENLNIYAKNEVYSKTESDTRFVNSSGDEEIAGKKRFNSSVGIGTVPTGHLDNGKAIALGDGDTGIRQDGDGVLQIFGNNVRLIEVRENGIWCQRDVVLEARQGTRNESATRKDYVDGQIQNTIRNLRLEVDSKIAEAINGISGRSPRIDNYLYG